jgi:hypothetical protein
MLFIHVINIVTKEVRKRKIMVIIIIKTRKRRTATAVRIVWQEVLAVIHVDVGALFC